jgi:hypothetical protein
MSGGTFLWHMTLDRRGSYIVFSQAGIAAVDVASWDAHARRFFRTTLQPAGDGAVLVSPEGDPAGVRRICARQRDPEDLALADAADAARSGLALLARRCPTVWLVQREADDDPLALRLATILASVLLGPILDARVPELLGAKSARARFER